MSSPKPQPGSMTPEFRFSPNPNKAHTIDWLSWGPEVFERAAGEKKPILLSLSAVWCHWCHVMDETSYSDEQIIAIINERYIPVRVDADKRPDIQERYIMGGWPTTAILTTNGETMSGGTYVPPQEFISLLEKVGDYYAEHRDRLEEAAEEQRKQILQAASMKEAAHFNLDESLVSDVLDMLQRTFDAKHGGFSDKPKFPNSPVTELLLRRAYLENNTDWLEMASRTLTGMADGGLFDREWGGFFRYSTESDWSEPHYEKMLGDNAALILDYLRGYQVSGNIKYRDVAEKTLAFIDSYFADKKNGGFAGSQDANEEFYKLDADERLKHKLPFIDPIVYVDTNAAMVSAYLEAYQVLGDEPYRDFALRSMDFLMETCFSAEAGMAHYFDGEAHLFGRISSQAGTIGALLDAYSVTGAHKYLDSATALAGICEKTLLNNDGTFADSSDTSGEPHLGALAVKTTPVQENALLARQLYRLSYLGGDSKYEEMVGRTLAGLELGSSTPITALALFVLAVDEFLTQPVVLTAVTTGTEPGAKELLREAFRTYVPGKVIKLLDPVRDYEVVEGLGYPAEKHPVIYPCIGRMCLPAVETPHELKGILEDLPGRRK
ncbi:MAG: DUF255 domain-containing protein [Candidatus Aquicultor sp.]|nr:DUF255 domain-containing protein [Candidatus Aquicultor sp.]